MKTKSSCKALIKVEDLSFESVRKKVYSFVNQLPDSEKFDAQQILNNSPELYHHKSIVLDLIYEEYCREVEAGNPIEDESFANRFPEYEKSILNQIAIHRLLEQENSPQLLSNNESEFPQVGDTVFDFHLTSELGKGAFSKVFLGRDNKLAEREVVVKFCLHGSQEAEILAQLEHPSITPIFSIQTDEQTGLTAICMPFLGHLTLLDLLDAIASNPSNKNCKSSQPLPSKQLVDGRKNKGLTLFESASHFATSPVFTEAVIALAIEISSALSFVHTQGYCHGDIKPSNVLIAEDGHAILLDFNLSYSSQTNLKRLGGTLPYMAPEQLLEIADKKKSSENQVGDKSDLFQFGATIYELLTGTLPFGEIPSEKTHSAIAAKLYQCQKNGPASICLLNPSVDRHFANLIERCLSFDPELRPSSADFLVAEFKTLLTPKRKLFRLLKHHQLYVLTSLVATLLLFFSLFYHNIISQPDQIQLLKKGWQFQNNGGHLKAVSSFSKAIKTNPKFLDARFSRACSYMSLGEYQNAIDDLIEINAHRKDGRVLAAIAYCLYQSGEEKARSITLFNEAIQEGFENQFVLCDLGHLYLKSSSLENSEFCFLKAIQKDTTLLPAYLGMAEIELRKSLLSSKFPNLDYIDSAIQLDPENAEVYFYAAELYSQTTRLSQELGHDIERYKVTTSKYCRMAAEKGVDAKQYQRLTEIYGQFNQIQEFKESFQPNENPPIKIPRMINPLTNQLNQPIRLTQNNSNM